MRECPAWEGETFTHYLWRLAGHLGRDAGPEPKPAHVTERLATLRAAGHHDRKSDESRERPA